MTSKFRKWTTEEDAILKSKYYSTPNKDLATLFERSANKVCRRASRLGLYKDPELISRMISSANKGKNNSMDRNPRWKGGRSIDREGYVFIRVDGRARREHRHVMEQHLGRKLTRGEVVHHINHDRSDNRIENLQIMSWSDHGALHSDTSIKNLKLTPSHRAFYGS